MSSHVVSSLRRCSGDSRVLCGTDARISVYSIDDTPTPTPPTPTPSSDYVELGCAEDNVNGVRVRNSD